MPRGGARPNTGGRRPGAGRKPKAIREAVERVRLDCLDVAGEAFALELQFMRDVTLPSRLRLDAARDAMDRVWGRPPQRLAVTGADDGSILIQVVYEGAPAGQTEIPTSPTAERETE